MTTDEGSKAFTEPDSKYTRAFCRSLRVEMITESVASSVRKWPKPCNVTTTEKVFLWSRISFKISLPVVFSLGRLYFSFCCFTGHSKSWACLLFWFQPKCSYSIWNRPHLHTSQLQNFCGFSLRCLRPSPTSVGLSPPAGSGIMLVLITC